MQVYLTQAKEEINDALMEDCKQRFCRSLAGIDAFVNEPLPSSDNDVTEN